MSAHRNICLASLTSTGCPVQNCRKKHKCSCGVLVCGYQQDEHIRGKRHTKAVDALQRSADATEHTSSPQIRRNYDDWEHCEVCNKDIPSFRWDFHLNHPEHLRTQRLADTQAALDHTAQDKNSVKVSGETAGIDFGVIEPENALGSFSVQSRVVKIRTEDVARISLTNIRITSSMHESARNSR